MQMKPTCPSYRLLAIALCAALCAACEHSERRSSARTPQSNYAVHIERGADAPCDSPRCARRSLAFEVTGFAPSAAAGTASDQKAAVTQAAVIDGLAQAIIESRRNRGEPTADFTVKLSPRLTLTHRQMGEGYEVEATLLSRGVDTTFVVKNGVLQHPPQELRLLRQLFDESRGEFELLATRWEAGGCQARVACYEPATAGPSLAADAPKSQ